METTDAWLKRPDIKSLRELSTETYRERGFPRDPMRAIHYDPSVFLSPADGHIVTSKIVQPGKDIVNIKGSEYTIDGLLGLPGGEKIFVPCLVIQIFLCIFDVHYNRCPLDGYLTYRNLDAVVPVMESMIPVEDALLEKLELKAQYLKYNTKNERKVNRIYSPAIQQPYYIVQIADVEVDAVLHRFDGDKQQSLVQGDRFAFITHGSQTDLIIPLILESPFSFTSLVNDKIGWHVEAGIDALVKITEKKK